MHVSSAALRTEEPFVIQSSLCSAAGETQRHSPPDVLQQINTQQHQDQAVLQPVCQHLERAFLASEEPPTSGSSYTGPPLFCLLLHCSSKGL
ncbi:hypothetical protein KUCAC02_036297 [Chaenocephalus aceratus]|nr:hypothetical protein KUCAC02_036297 [Chaenocephalus aceratus]